MVIIELADADRPAWDTYVHQAPGGLPQHLSGWRDVLARTYGYETHYLMAREGGAVVGVLPLFLVPSILVGNAAKTMPGGLCAESPEVAAALIARASEIARRANARTFVLQDTRQAWPGDLQTTSHHVHWVVDLRAGAEDLWHRLDGNIRRQVRLARRSGLTIEIDRSGRRLGEFHNVLSHFTHQVGTPVFGRCFLEHIVAAFPEGFNIAVVYDGHQPIGAYFQLEMGRTVYGTWGAALREYLKLRPVYLAYWEMLADMAAQGYHFLDMGRSPADSNASTFKGQWGGSAHPVYQQMVSLGGSRPAGREAGALPSGVTRGYFSRIWSRLPFPVVQFLGPRLRRHMPFA
ncbi:MAG TPA: hypothetical protein DEP84_32580 [Chloroflexi bacterium]|nr:hypothetical protein [Chloroflexota bacterium]